MCALVWVEQGVQGWYRGVMWLGMRGSCGVWSVGDSEDVGK